MGQNFLDLIHYFIIKKYQRYRLVCVMTLLYDSLVMTTDSLQYKSRHTVVRDNIQIIDSNKVRQAYNTPTQNILELTGHFI